MRSIAIMQRVLTEILRDKRTLALLFLAPLMILTLMYFLFQESNKTVANLGVYDVDSRLLKELKNDQLSLKKYENDKNSSEKMLVGQLDGFLSFNSESNTLKLTMQNSNLGKSAIITQSLQKALNKFTIKQLSQGIQNEKKAMHNLTTSLEKLLATLPIDYQQSLAELAPYKEMTTHPLNSYDLKIIYNYGNKNTTFFDTIVPLMMGFFIFFFVFLISGIALLKERTSGTLERLLATPVKRRDIVFGYIGGYGLFAFIQTLMIMVYTILVLHVEVLGKMSLVLLICLLLAFVALNLGVFISTFANSEFQMIQFIPLLIVPQLFFSGLIPIETMPTFFQGLAKLMPLYYGATALTDIITKGYTFSMILTQLLSLSAFGALLVLINILGLKRYRKV